MASTLLRPLCLLLALLVVQTAAVHDRVRGVIILARNGDRLEYYQDPLNYSPGKTQHTPLGAVQSFQLGTYLHSVYLAAHAPSRVDGIDADLVNTDQVFVRSAAGGEGYAVYDSALALLQGLFPPTLANNITLANATVVVSPLNGYQYIPIRTVDPGMDHSLQPWTDCPAFENHIKTVMRSDAFRKHADDAAPFLRNVKDYVFGPEVSFANMWNVHEFVSSQLMHNRSYAYRLPPSMVEQSRAFVNLHQAAIFSSPDIGSVANIAGRTMLRAILQSLTRIAYNGDPLQLFVTETTYQPFISLLHMLEAAQEDPSLAGLPNFASALAIELRRGDEGDSADYLRFQFKNGTADSTFRPVRIFGHSGDIALTEFIYRTENYQIASNSQWASVCNARGVAATSVLPQWATTTHAAAAGALALALLSGLFVTALLRKRRAQPVRLSDYEFERGALLAGSAPLPVDAKTRY